MEPPLEKRLKRPIAVRGAGFVRHRVGGVMPHADMSALSGAGNARRPATGAVNLLCSSGRELDSRCACGRASECSDPDPIADVHDTAVEPALVEQLELRA
jgi:hypothetical protein